MLAGYGRYLNDNVRTVHLKCSACRTRVHLTKIESDDQGTEVRSFACPHCRAISTVRLSSPDSKAEPKIVRSHDAC